MLFIYVLCCTLESLDIQNVNKTNIFTLMQNAVFVYNVYISSKPAKFLIWTCLPYRTVHHQFWGYQIENLKLAS